MSPAHVSLAFAFIVTAIAAVYDLRTWRIPNALSVGALAAAPVAHFAFALSTQGARAGFVAAGWSIAGGALCGVVPWLCWRAGTFGGGDVKLLAAVGAVCLPKVGVTIEFDAMIVGLVLAFGRLAYEGLLFRTLARSAFVAVNPLLPKTRRHALPVEAMTPMRFAPAIAGGVLLCAILQPA
jgi:prepilin peptidase CpaA